MNPIVKGILTAVGVFAACMVIQYVASLVKGTTFSPDWVIEIIVAVFAGVLTVVGPDAAQRKKNRENLVKKFKK